MELKRVPFSFAKLHLIHYIHPKFLAMLRKHWILYLLLFISITANAQERYEIEWFEDIRKETFTYATKEGQNLDLDIYLPQGDSELERPTLIYMHGGGFSQGNRDDEGIVEFCNHMAQYGYVVASISYRLTRKDQPGGFSCDCPAVDKLNTFSAAVEDIQDATYFLIENREQFAIDPQKIILAGSSAGAEGVLNAAYQPPYCYDLESGPVSYAGVIGMAGAIPDATILYDESAVPSLLFHGTDDPLVPYGTAPHHYCSEDSPGYLILDGSQTIANKLRNLDTPYWLHTSCGAGHEIASLPMTEFFETITEFCHTFVVKGEGDQRETIVKGEQNAEKFSTYNFCEE